MKGYIPTTLLMSSLLFFPLSAAFAQQDQQMAKDAKRAGQAQQQEQFSRIEGKVLDVRQAKVRGGNREHLLAKVRLDDAKLQDRTVVLDFGPVDRLKSQNAKVEKDSQIRASGRRGTVNQQPVLMVYQFDVIPLQAGRGQASQRQGTSQTARGSLQPDQQRKHVISGQITEMRDIQLKGLQEKSALFKLKTQAGREVVINAGAPSALDKLALKKGDQVVASGNMGRINDKQVLFADMVAEVAEVQGDKDRNKQRDGSAS